MARKGDKARQDRAWADYSEEFRKSTLPKLLASAHLVMVASTPDPDHIRIQAATELGLMLLLDKPLILIVPPGETAPSALRRAATIVLDDFDVTDPASQGRLAAIVRDWGETKAP